MAQIKISAGRYSFIAKMEEEKAPRTCEAFKALLPWKTQIIHVRWSGCAMWAPLGDFHVGFGNENHTSYPSKGEILFYPGGLSETEILIPYDSCIFSSRVGLLAGNHFLTIERDLDVLAKLGNEILWTGAKELLFEFA